MNPDQTNPQPVTSTPSIPPITQMPPEKKGSGMVIVLVIAFIILLGLSYLYMSKMSTKDSVEETPSVAEQTTQTPNDAAALQAAVIDTNTTQGTSIDISDIEKDLNATDLDTLSADVDTI